MSKNRRVRARSVLSAVDLVPMTNDLLDEAATLTSVLRTLDAIHLATACRLRGDLHAFVAYDKRLLGAAEDVGLVTVAPGAEG
jgi:predicted nucleic acid-binding protein